MSHSPNGHAPERERWIGVGRSSHPDASRAGREAARAAVPGSHAALAIVLASDAYDLPALADAVTGALGNTPVVGCSTAGEIATDGPGDAGVVVFCLGGAGFSVTTGFAPNASHDLRAAGAAAAG